MFSRLWLYTLFSFIFLIHQGNAQQCTFTINTDLEIRTPILLEPDGTTLIIPDNTDGQITMNNSNWIYLACSGNTNFVEGLGSGTPKKKIVKAECRTGNAFSIDGDPQTQAISNIRCYQYPQPFTRVVGTCNRLSDLIEIGLVINDTYFMQRMKVCFNSYSLTTYWASTIQRGTKYAFPMDSTTFKKDYFGTVDPDDRYKNINLNYPANNILQKGHLIGKADFPDAPGRRMSYYYINTTPQWKKFNEGNWKNLEYQTRNQIDSNRDLHEVYTGTYGNYTNNNGILYLDSQGKMPVSLYLWKVVVNSKSKKGIAFVGVNDVARVQPNICTDICSNVSWLSATFQQSRNNYTLGTVICCKINDLQAVSGIELPAFSNYDGNSILT